MNRDEVKEFTRAREKQQRHVFSIPSPSLEFKLKFENREVSRIALQSTVPLIQRCVVVTREVDGYGLTVTGDHPVFVHTVKHDGAAYRAGVRQGDKILKVNGMPVTASNHLEVVRMISGGQTVALTLLGPPPEPRALDAPEILQMESYVSKAVINEPLFVEKEGNEEWKRKRVKIIGKMLEEERQHVEGLRETSVENEQLERALKRIESLQNQLRNIENIEIQEKWEIKDDMHPVQPTDIITMEEETDDDDRSETPLDLEAQGHFSNFADLKMHPAHLAAFINYLLTNANPSSVFFYLITDAYQNSNATAKELRKWAYEIFSTFLIPNSPLTWDIIDQSMILQSIDKILAETVHATDNDISQLIKIFALARKKALDNINEHLADFRQKRLIGLGSLFDANQLAHISKGDAAMETRVGEAILVRSLENLLNLINHDLENCEPRSLAIISALATVIKIVLNMRSNTNEKILDRCPTFVTKDKVGMFRMKMAPKRPIQIKGHQFLLTPVNVTVYCYQCRDAIWGVNAQAYFCQNCDVVVHKQCTSSLPDHCYRATQKKSVPGNKTKRTGFGTKHDNESFEGNSTLTDNIRSISVVADKGFHMASNVKSVSSDSGIGADMEKPVSRSQSMRSPADEMQDWRRNRSAFSWGGTLPPPEELEERPRRAQSDLDSENKTSPITLNRSLLDAVSLSGSSSVSHTSGGDEEIRRLMEKIEKNDFADCDSDLEIDTEVPSLESFVGWEIVRRLKPKEKKRQEVINELFHTERTHVRNLKILYKVFYKPMVLQNIAQLEIIKLLFPNLEELLEVHCNMSRLMRDMVEEWKQDSNLNGLFGDVGSLMEELFDGENGTKLMEATATFCQHQQYALDVLRKRCKKEKDDQLSRFLIEAECNPLCRKLQLKDMLPVEMQRLVKYPLLLENIAKYTLEPSEEQTKLLNSVNSAKRILTAVNTAKRNAENLRRLEELQKRLVATPTTSDRENYFHSFNLKHYKLVYDGPLTWRCSRNKMIEMHVVLLENILLLLTKAGDGNKLILKHQEPSKETRWSPILPLITLIAKEKANDKRALFIINTMERDAQIYELVATSASERKTWFKLISDQIDLIKCENINAQPNIGQFDVNATTNQQYDEDDIDFCHRVKVSTHPKLVNANEVIIEHPTTLQHAQPILTPTERLRRNDEVIMKALLDKQTILANFLPGSNKDNITELENLAEQLTGLAVTELKQRDGQELAMSAIVHGNRLLDAINAGLKARKDTDDSGNVVLKLDNIEKDDVPTVACYKLTAIAAPLMNHLKAMLHVIQEQQIEIKTIKQQLHQYKELASNANHSDNNQATVTENIDDCNVTENVDCNQVKNDAETERRKRLQTKRQRNAALTVSISSIQPPHSSTNS